MGSETDSSGNSGVFSVEDVPRFDARQAWNHRLAAAPGDQFMSVGEDEVLRLSRDRKPTLISRQESELALIRQVIQTGPAHEVDILAVDRVTEELKNVLGNMRQPSENLVQAYSDWRDVVQIEKLARDKAKIERAAGYIAARQSIWIVIKSTPVTENPRGPLNIGVARLRGLGVKEARESISVVPIVAGKNSKLGRLENVVQGNAHSRVRPRVLDIIEGIRTRP